MQHGNTYQFSNSFNGMMYRDNSLWAASMKRAYEILKVDKNEEKQRKTRLDRDAKKNEAMQEKLEMV